MTQGAAPVPAWADGPVPPASAASGRSQPGEPAHPGGHPHPAEPAHSAEPAHHGRPPRPGPRAQVSGLADALSSFASGVTLVMVADGRDDIGTTVSAFCPVSLSPPIVLVSLIAGSYPAEVLSRAERFAVTVLAAGQRALAGRFAAAGRPGARLMLEGTPHGRGTWSGALIPDGGLAALECEVSQRVPAGDHLLVIATVQTVPYVAEAGDPLIRFAGRYPSLR